jgi:hypothetical protein
MAIWGRLMSAIQAGITDWRDGPQQLEIDAYQRRYAERHMLALGNLFLDVYKGNPYLKDPRVYRNISLLWNHTPRVVDFYTTMIYQGALRDVPGEGAIPIRPDKNLKDEQVTNLMAVIDVLNQKWNWQRQMVRRPKMGAMLGDVLTELVEVDQFVYPRFVWPGFVKKIETDIVGNVVSYTLEYRATEVDDKGNGQSYTYRKVVDRESFRYFKNDDPFDYSGEGSVISNPWGFVPAVWDNHIAPIMGNRGEAATDASRQALLSLNSLFSHSRDFQHKAFFAPIIVRGQLTSKAEATIDLSSPGGPSELAKRLHFLEASADNAGLDQPTFDIGQTVAQLEFMRDGILMNHPEATFFDKLSEKAHVTGPGADKIILPVKGLVEHARSGYDTGQVRIYQMATTMIAMRVNEGDWGDPDSLSKSRQAFKPYTLDSYRNEEMAFSIPERPIVTPSRAEIIEQAREIESLQTVYGLSQVMSEDEAKAVLADKRAAYQASFDSGLAGETLYGEGAGAA